MPWTDPSTHIWAAGERLTAANLNTYVEANLAYLYGDTGWTNATLTNSYTAVGVVRFMLIGRVVYIQGAVTGGTVNTSAFTLPAGYRPSQGIAFAVIGNAAICQLTIAATGTVTPVTTGTAVNVTCSFPVV